MTTQSNYFKDFGFVELGDLTRVNEFLTNVQLKLHKVRRINIREPLDIDLNFDKGNHMQVTRYGPYVNAQFVFTGENLKYLFDDWTGILAQAEEKVKTKIIDPFPRIIYIDTHTYRHIDKRRAALNIGLWQVDTAATLFWEGRKLVASANMDVGQLLVLNTEVSHSVVLDDSLHYMTPRAILTADIADGYFDI